MSIEICDLVVTYKGHLAVDGLTLSVPKGSCFGLLGPNGAGKSSTIRCVATTQSPTSGSITVAGHDTRADPREVRRQLGGMMGIIFNPGKGPSPLDVGVVDEDGGP